MGIPPRYTDLTRWRLSPETLPVWRSYRRRLAAYRALQPCAGTAGNHRYLGLVRTWQRFSTRRTGYEKPHPQAFRNVLQSLEAPEALWMIGDNPNADIAGAAALGIPGILSVDSSRGQVLL